MVQRAKKFPGGEGARDPYFPRLCICLFMFAAIRFRAATR